MVFVTVSNKDKEQSILSVIGDAYGFYRSFFAAVVMLFVLLNSCYGE